MKSCDCPRSDHPHGTLRRYAVHRCRCFACRVTHSASQRAYRAGRSWLEVDYRPAIGVRRRLQALAVIGWSANRLAPHLGMTGEYVAKIRTDKQGLISCDTWAAVAALYDRLWDKPITDPDGRRTSTIARQLGYLPPLAWDDAELDDPAARVPIKPTNCGTSPGYRQHLRRGEPPCADCSGAERRRSAERRAAKRREAA